MITGQGFGKGWRTGRDNPRFEQSATPHRRWQTFKNGFWNATRYLLIAGMFAFLLTMIILLNEVMNFHNGIVEQVSEPYARRVVLMLDKMNSYPEAYPEEPALPVAELAVELDGVRHALRELDHFAKILPSPDEVSVPSPDRQAPTGPGESEDESAPEEVFKDRSAALQVRLDSLRDTLYGASPFVAVASALQEFKDSVRELRQFEIAPAKSGGPGPAEESAETSAPVALEGQISRMEDELDTLGRGVRALPHADLLSTQLANLKGQIEQLQGYQYVANLTIVAPDDRKAEAPPAAGHSMSLARPMAGTTRAVVAGAAGPGSAAASVPVAAEHKAAEIEKPVAASGEAPAADASPIAMIEDSLREIDGALRAAFPDFSLFSAVSTQVQSMRAQADAFDHVTGSEYRGDGDEPLGREAAEEQFDEARQGLGDAIDEVEGTLQERTRVITLANVIRDNPDLSDAGAAAMARTILHDFDGLERFQHILMPMQWFVPADWALARAGIAPKRLATLSTDSIQTIYIFMIGAIGSLLYITRYHLKLALEGNWLGSPPTRPLPWLLFRPFFGVVVAFAVYLLVRAGQFAFGTSPEDGVGTDVNIPILSVVALFAGLLAWQALEAIETRGRRWFSSQTREPLWATGLDNALRTSARTIAECGSQIGRSSEQIERWLLFRDRVTVEMQDRIQTWLDKPLDELFGRNEPKDQLGGRPMWAVGLKAALDNRERRLEEEGLAELLHEEKRPENVERIQKWINLKLQVSPAMQWQLVDLLGVPHSQLFASVVPDRPVWALHLRRALERRGENAQKIADRLGLDVASIHAWKELDKAVPTANQDKLMSTLARGFSDLFEPEPKEDDWLILANNLGPAIDRKYGKRDLQAFAADVDVDVARVEDWIERRKAVAMDTRATIVRVLGPEVLGPEPDLFSPPKLPS